MACCWLSSRRRAAFGGQVAGEAATNCLTRVPDARRIPVVAIDSNHVGIIELQRCMQAIVVASPEMLSRIDTSDFAICAFNYSEYDTVGLPGSVKLCRWSLDIRRSHRPLRRICGSQTHVENSLQNRRKNQCHC